MEQLQASADDLLLFSVIADQGSLIAAAERLGMPKATVSRRLAGLEARLGQRLLIRTTRRLALTEFGQGFLEHCRRVAEEVAAAEDFLRSQTARPQGRLRVSMPGDFARHHLSRAIATFVEQHAGIELELDLSTRRVDLIGERFDLAIRMGRLDDDATLVARKLDELSLGLYASPIYLASHPAPLHPDGLFEHQAVRQATASSMPQAWRLSRERASWEAVPPGRLTVNAPDMVQQLLLDGAGIGVLPALFAAPDVEAGRLRRLLPDWQLPGVPAWAVMPTRRYLPAKTRAFIEHIAAALRTPSP